MIVKVQVSYMSTAPQRQVLVYDKGRRHEWHGPASEDVLRVMGGDNKAFFRARVDKRTGMMKLVERARWQNW